MAVIVGDIRLPLEAEEGFAIKEALRRLSLQAGDAVSAYIHKSSPDLRHKNTPSIVYSVGVELGSEKEEEAAVATAASAEALRARPVKA